MSLCSKTKSLRDPGELLAHEKTCPDCAMQAAISGALAVTPSAGFEDRFWRRFEDEFGVAKVAPRRATSWVDRIIEWMPPLPRMAWTSALAAAGVAGILFVGQIRQDRLLRSEIKSSGVPMAVLAGESDFFEKLDLLENLDVLDSADFDQVVAANEV